MSEQGHVITAPISAINQLQCDEVWQITRSDKVVPGCHWVPELAPTWDLFNLYNSTWKGQPSEDWWPEYVERFNADLKLEEKLQALRQLYTKIKQGKVIALVCFCPTDTNCHRRLVGEFMANYGITVEESSRPAEDILQQICLF